MSQRPRAQRAAPTDRPSSRLMTGLYAAWIGVAVMVTVCTLTGLGWGFRRQSDGLPTAVIALRNAPTPDGLPTYTALPTLIAPAPITPGSGGAGLPDPAAGFGYGIQTRLSASAAASLDRARELGLGWVKYAVRWSQIEAEPGQIEWGDLDAAMSAASARNQHVLLTIGDAPGWARSVTAKGKTGPPDNPQTYTKIVTLILQRYSGAVHAVEIWDNENLDAAWYAPGGLSAAGYLNLLIPTAQAIRQIDPRVIIISGALTPTGKNDGINGIDDFAYMQSLLDGKLLDHVDCVGARHDGFNLPPTLTAEDAFSGGMPPGAAFAGPYDTSNPSNPHHSWSFTSTLNGYRELIVATGRDTPLCVTEFGWASAEDMGAPPPELAFARDNTSDEQARYITRAFRLMHDWGFVRLAILYNLDYAVSPVDEQAAGTAYFSILKPNGQPRAAYFALRDMPKLP